MFANNLRAYAFQENGKRHRDDRICLATAWVVAFAMLALGQSAHHAAIGGLVALSICMTFLTLRATVKP